MHPFVKVQLLFHHRDSFPVPLSGFTDEPEAEVGSSGAILLAESIARTSLVPVWVAPLLLLPAAVDGVTSGGISPLLMLYRQVGQVSCYRGKMGVCVCIGEGGRGWEEWTGGRQRGDVMELAD